MPAKCPLTIFEVAPFFQFPIEEAATRLGVCVTVLKKVCRSFGIKRWPLQRLRYLDQRLSQYGVMAQWTPEIREEIRKLILQRQEILNGLSVDLITGDLTAMDLSHILASILAAEQGLPAPLPPASTAPPHPLPAAAPTSSLLNGFPNPVFERRARLSVAAHAMSSLPAGLHGAGALLPDAGGALSARPANTLMPGVMSLPPQGAVAPAPVPLHVLGGADTSSLWALSGAGPVGPVTPHAAPGPGPFLPLPLPPPALSLPPAPPPAPPPPSLAPPGAALPSGSSGTGHSSGGATTAAGGEASAGADGTAGVARRLALRAETMMSTDPWMGRLLRRFVGFEPRTRPIAPPQP